MTPNRTILVVNDHEAGRYSTVRILRRAGFDVAEASTGAEGLALVAAKAPALVVLDVNLPDMSGIDICRRLKAGIDKQFVMVLQVSATNVSTADRVAALEAGADSFLIDPMEPEELVAVARALLRLHEAEEVARRHVAERDVLLAEVNHRVKNSLQLVSSILSLQRRRLSDQSVADTFDQAIARVRAIAAIHERLYRSAHPLTVDMEHYLTELAADLAAAGRETTAEATIEVEADQVELSADTAVPLGVVVNELVTNALKYAHPTHGPVRITIAFTRKADGEHELTVADNGARERAASAADAEKGGLGSMLIKAMVGQIGGRLEARQDASGYRAIVTLPARKGAAWPSAS